MIMEPPPGYPPPTLIRRKSRATSPRFILLFLTLFAGLGFYIVHQLLDGASPPLAPVPVARTVVDRNGVADADAAPAALPDMTKSVEAPPLVEKPVDTGIAKARDARKPNQWYFVGALGDGPAAIYSRDGGPWNFAFACTAKTRRVEFIAVGTGSPGSFDRQVIKVGKVRLMMDATYSKEGGGTISTSLPASHPFFNALTDKATMEVQLVSDRKTTIPVGPNVVRLIRACRGGA